MTKRIISVSRRTDICAFYSQWFMHRVRAGYCEVANPFNPQQVAVVGLTPDDVSCFVFWSRNPQPLFAYLDELDHKGYYYYFLITLIGYPKEIDPCSPSVSKAIRTFRELSSRIGPEKVIWRYDPVLLSNYTDREWHLQQFLQIAQQLRGYTKRVIVSVIDPYKKTKSRLQRETSKKFRLNPDVFQPAAYASLLCECASIARKEHIQMQMCAEEFDCADAGIVQGKCIDDELIASIGGTGVSSRKDPSQRKTCHCVISKDIGAHNTCLYGCRYCYATRNIEQAHKNFEMHDSTAPRML